MLKKWLLASCALACAIAQAATLKTAKGDVEFDKAPERVVVLDPGMIDTFIALGLSDKIVGIPGGRLAEEYGLGDVAQVGTFFEPDLEKLNELKPDLIVVAVRTQAKYDDVSKVAKTVDLTLEGKNSFQEGVARLNSVGEVFGKADEAKALTEELNGLRDEVKKLAEGKGKVLGLLVNGQKIALYGPQSRANWLASELGLNLVHDDKKVGRHGEPVTFEYVAEVNPDWIYALDRLSAIGQDGASAKQTLDNPLVHGTTAWKNNQVIYPNTHNIYINVGGPKALKEVMVELKEAFGGK
ncbi:MAG: ABC transporter substrate-binding protein [Cardiobacteriaceae bacterium]|nr:ABC transporter substrate-binding protein [Cardiobacteriaceae bacterium]